MERKKKLRIIQLSLLFIGISIIIFTYADRKRDPVNDIFTKETQEKIRKQLSNQNQTAEGDIFFNIEYSGLDLAGNRYILKAEQATNKKENLEIVNMDKVTATFFFKDNTTLYVTSDNGIYNNKTLDMKFFNNVEATYEGSELYSQKADYSNSNSFLTISENVKIKDQRGTMLADKLFFDIKKQKLNIASFNDGKINANINLK